MGKKILITGSNKGIGFEVAQELLRSAPEFDKIIITARNQELGLAAKERLNGGDRIDFHLLDVSNQESISSLKDYILNTYGTIDILFNNAAILTRVTENYHLLIQQHVATNTYGVINVTEALVDLIAPNGHIINVSAMLGKTEWLKNPEFSARLLDQSLNMEGLHSLINEFNNIGNDWAEKGWHLEGYGVYSHTKAFVNAYTRLLANNLASNGSSIRVNALCPGWVRTDMGGENAALSLEEGIITPIIVIKDTSNITGKFWSRGQSNDIS